MNPMRSNQTLEDLGRTGRQESAPEGCTPANQGEQQQTKTVSKTRRLNIYV